MSRVSDISHLVLETPFFLILGTKTSSKEQRGDRKGFHNL